MPNSDTAPGSTPIDLQEKLTTLENQLLELKTDIQFIKAFFIEKQEKRERRRQQKLAEEAAIAKQKQDNQNRQIYEDIVRSMTWRPWTLMPRPESLLSPKEMQLAALLAQQKTDKQIAVSMSIKEISIPPRIHAALKKLKASINSNSKKTDPNLGETIPFELDPNNSPNVNSVSKNDLIAYYLKVQSNRKKHRHNRCRVLLSWLLNPPPGKINRRNFKIGWIRFLGRGMTFKNTGPYIPLTFFDKIKQREHTVLKLRLRGIDYATIAERLKVKEITARGYLNEIRTDIKWDRNVSLSEESILSFYKKYLSMVRKRAAQHKPR